MYLQYSHVLNICTVKWSVYVPCSQCSSSICEGGWAELGWWGGSAVCCGVCLSERMQAVEKGGGGVLSRSDTLAGHVVELKYYLSGININYRLYLHSAHF